MEVKKGGGDFLDKNKDFISNILLRVRSELDDESIKTVEHYIQYDEYEMAFEVLFIEIMKLIMFRRLI